MSHHIDRILSILDARRLAVVEDLTPVGSAHTRTSTTGSSSTDADGTVSMIELLAGHDSRKDLDGFTLEYLQPHLDALEGFSQPMYRTIEETISDRAVNIATLHSNTLLKPDTTPAEALERVLADTREKVATLDRIQEEAILYDRAVQQEVQWLFDTLQKTILVLWEVVLEFRIRHQFEQNTTFQEYFASLSESIILKLEYVNESSSLVLIHFSSHHSNFSTLFFLLLLFFLFRWPTFLFMSCLRKQNS